MKEIARVNFTWIKTGRDLLKRNFRLHVLYTIRNGNFLRGTGHFSLFYCFCRISSLIEYSSFLSGKNDKSLPRSRIWDQKMEGGGKLTQHNLTRIFETRVNFLKR